ncbi:uncharacterized protein LOC114787132 isoform X2 [Denticeps clupeoides]|uniref:uncharacterized protein LOC114787132 isoform X2 n=1 Tax=Denticeps clupeoides TaxID=299321 RepID=UPI0010A33B73|nr:uncharacterized protein LOC114787132 isoform X2 [Denticeps clupeoides]
MACCPSPCRRDNVLAWLLCSDPSHVLEALGVLCALAQESRRALVEQILRESSRKQCAVVLTTLLRSPDPWLCSSAAYIFGALLENEALVQELQEWTPGDNNPVGLLAQLLARDDPNTVMYSAGAVASLAESSEGRKWLLKRDDICRQVLDHLPQLLENIRDSTVNSAALILARLCLCEVACQSLLSHSSAADTIKRLVQCLGHGHTDTAMNAAFAVGRLCGSELGRTLILAEAREHKLVSSLQTLLCKEAGPDAGQTACFALSCLATDTDGHTLLLDSPSFPSVLDGLFQLLLRKEPDCAWFAAMTVKVFVSRPSGVLRVRQHRLLEQQLQSLSSCPFLGLELQEEVNGCLRKLQRLPKPFPVRVNRLIQGSYAVTWEPCVPESGLEVTYSLLNKDSILYCGPMCHMTIPPSLLASGKTLFLQLKLSTSDGDTSPCSEPAVFETEKVRQRPGPPRELLVIGCTATQVRLRWIAPEGEVKPKKYRIFRENVLLETTGELGVIVGGLSPGTHYHLRVCAVGPGDMLGPGAEVQVHTVEFQDHAPSTLSVAVLGRHELHISWGAPVVPLGRLFNYEGALSEPPHHQEDCQVSVLSQPPSPSSDS